MLGRIGASMTGSLDCLAEDRVEACRAVARARGASIGLSRTMLLLEFDKTVVQNAARKGEKHHEAHHRSHRGHGICIRPLQPCVLNTIAHIYVRLGCYREA